MANPRIEVEIGAVIEGLRRGFGESVKIIDKLEEQAKQLEKALNDATDVENISSINRELAKTRAAISQLRNAGLEEFGDQAERAGKKVSGLNEFAKGALQGIAAAFSVGAIINFGKAVIDATAQFQKFEAVLTNTLGSNLAAKVALDEISEFASTTPFQVEEVTDAFVKLANQGFKPTISELRNLGDLAASTGKDFNQLAEAIIDAQVGEFERLKEFGITASKAGDNVTFSFKGVETQVKNTEQAIRDYILSLGSIEGVSGATAAISDTVGGKISNLGDNITKLQVAIGDSSKGLIAGVLDLSNALLEILANSISAVNTISEKTAEGGFKSFLRQIIALTNPAYNLQLQLQAAAIKEADKAALAASQSVAEVVKETKELTDTEKLAIYKEALKKFVKGWDDYNLATQNATFANDRLKESIEKTSQFDYGKYIKGLKTELSSLESSLEKAISGGEESNIIQNLQTKINNVKAVLAGFGEEVKVIPIDIKFNFEGDAPQQDDKPQEDKSLETKFQLGLKSLDEEFKAYSGDFIARVTEFVSTVKNIIQQNMFEAFIGVGEAIGSAFAKGENILSAVGQSLLDSLSTFLGDLGQQLIAFGVAGTAFGSLLEAIKKGGPASIPAGIAAIAAGTALIAISSAIRSRASRGPSGAGGGSSVGTSGVGAGTSFTGSGIGFAFDPSREIRGELVARGQDLVYVFNEANTRINKG